MENQPLVPWHGAALGGEKKSLAPV